MESEPNTPQPSTLQVFVADNVKTHDVAMRTEPPQIQPQIGTPDESRRLVGPHNQKARWVREADMTRLMAEAKVLLQLCRQPMGGYAGSTSMSHTYINDKDPLRFFVINNGMVVVNPVIIDSTKVPTLQTEGCIAFYKEKPKTLVPRYNKITVTYQTLTKKKDSSDLTLTNPITETMNGKLSHLFQHECSHLNGFNIFDKDYNGRQSLFLGDDQPFDPGMWNKEKLNE